MCKVFHRDFLGAHRYTTRGGTVDNQVYFAEYVSENLAVKELY